MIEVTEKGKCYKAFYYTDPYQTEVDLIVNENIADLLNGDLDNNGCQEHLFLVVGEYKQTSCGNETIPITRKLVNVQRGNWILIEYEKDDVNDDIYLHAKMVSSATMIKKYKALIENIHLTLEGYEKQPELFENIDGLEIIDDGKVVADIKNPKNKNTKPKRKVK